MLEGRSGAPSTVYHVDGQGQALPDGGLRLDQTVTFDGETPQRRTWLMRPNGAHR